MGNSIRTLFVEDSNDDAELLILELRRGGYDLAWERVETASDLRAALDRGGWELVLADFSLPSFSGLDALALIRERGLDVPFILISGSIGEDTAVAAMKAGAHDYIMKGNLARLVPAVTRELREAADRRERRLAEENLRRSEEQLRQLQKMETLGQLAGGVAHDFNNVLGIIQGFTDLLLGRVAPDDPLRADIEEIRKAGRQASSLTSQLLAFSRKRLLRPQLLDLNAHVLKLATMFGRLLGENIELRTELAPNLDLVKADPGGLEQVILNLVVNARDAMPAGGRLTLETSNVRLDDVYAPGQAGVRAGPYARLSVLDTGVGMSPEVRARLFEPFFTTKEAGKGTGLGLATVYGIVQQSGGHIEVESQVGHGSSFRIYLPSANLESEAGRAGDAPASASAGSPDARPLGAPK